MRIAIIGGGASGLITAHLLDGVHDVTLFERDERLGGHIRTAGKNTSRGRIPGDVTLDNGVIEFEPTAFVNFHALLRTLDVRTERLRGATSLCLSDGRRLVSPGVADEECETVLDELALYSRLLPMALHDMQFRRAATRLIADPGALRSTPIGALFGDDLHCRWLRLLLMYAYSTPYPLTSEISSLIAAPVLSHMTRTRFWTRIVGGVYTYCERILERFGGVVHTGAEVTRVDRSDEVTVHVGACRRTFDAVVFATTPDQVLRLLSAPTEDERRRFGGFVATEARTFIHDDFSMYAPYDAHYYTEFDLFERHSGLDGGYNAYLNRLCDVFCDRHYGMAYNLEDRVRPESILQSETHVVPLLTVDALRYRHEIQAANGAQNTWFAGAWLGDGLHEGATTAALAVSTGLGGRTLLGATPARSARLMQ